MPQEVVVGGVFLESPEQVADRHVEVVVADGRCVEKHRRIVAGRLAYCC